MSDVRCLAHIIAGLLYIPDRINVGSIPLATSTPLNGRRF